MAKPGTVFQIRGQGYHFWVIISKPLDGKVLMVNVTDKENCPDSPCHLDSTDHPAFTKPCAIFYRLARTPEEKNVDRELASQQQVRQLADCSESSMARKRRTI